MHTVPDKDMMALEIVPCLPATKRGFSPTVPLAESISAILYKLETGAQWRQLPVKALFKDQILSWRSVYHHYRKWSVPEAWQDCWIKSSQRHKANFDLSSVGLDGSHAPAIRGGQGVGYQGRESVRLQTHFILQIEGTCPLPCLGLSRETMMTCMMLSSLKQ